SLWDLTHLMKTLSEVKSWNETERAFAHRGLLHSNPWVKRAAADALGRHPQPDQIRELCARYRETPVTDNHLRHTIRMAIRDHVAALPSAALLDDLRLGDADLREVASVCVATPTPIAAQLLVHYLKTHDENVTAYLQHIARYADASRLGDIVNLGR